MLHLPAKITNACFIRIQPDVYAVQGIIYPPIQPELMCQTVNEGAKANALYLPLNMDVPGLH
jgi:hypothetical protein